MRKTRFWFWVYRVLWHAADWVLTSRLRVGRDHPLRREVADFAERDARFDERLLAAKKAFKKASKKRLPHV